MRQLVRRALRLGQRAEVALAALERLPVVTLDELLAPGGVLVLAPHPDDESLGCGGLIATAAAAGRAVHVLVLTDGTGSHPGSRAWPGPRLRALRQAEAAAAVAELGVKREDLGFLDVTDGAAPRRGEARRGLVRRVADFGRAHGAGTICVTWPHDPHGDHVAAAAIGRGAARLSGARLLYYPVWGWTLPSEHRLPARDLRGWRLDVSASLPAKRRAIACHRSQTTTLIDDDPSGFRLDPRFLALFDRRFEVFLRG